MKSTASAGFCQHMTQACPFQNLCGWVDIAENLPKLLLVDQMRSIIESMPVVDINSLNTTTELERAMLAFSFIGHAYVWGQPDPPKNIPAPLAVPWHAVAKKLGRPPVLSYASYMLHNWQRIDPTGTSALGNTCLIQNFLGGLDEEWFILVHLDIEAKAGPALASILPAQQAVKDKDDTFYAPWN